MYGAERTVSNITIFNDSSRASEVLAVHFANGQNSKNPISQQGILSHDRRRLGFWSEVQRRRARSQRHFASQLTFGIATAQSVHTYFAYRFHTRNRTSYVRSIGDCRI